MVDARGQTVSLRIAGTSTAGGGVPAAEAEFAASGTVITTRGFLAAYEEGRDEAPADDSEERRLPPLHVGDPLSAVGIEPQGHATQPPSRYTEASLVKALEERGIGRPSTYASIMGTILDRGYVFKKGTALVPTFLAFAVMRLLEAHFAKLVDYDFTASMEEDLDRIAAGDEQRVEWLRRFYFGEQGLHKLVTDLGEIDAREINSIPIGDGIVLRVGRYGPYVERGEERANVPDDLAPDELTVELAEELLARPSGDKILGSDPTTGLDVIARAGRYGPYVTLALPEDSGEKPPTASLFKTMTLDSMTLDDALRLLTLPRTLGVDPGTGDEVIASNGRYGPFVKRGSDYRSLEAEERLFDVTLEQALELLAQPKTRGRGAAAAKPPLRELGPDPVSGSPMVIKEGRFGPYVTDGETNASLRKGDGIESLTVERAAELLADRRAAGPPKKRGAKKAAPKKSAAKKTTAKKSATKKAAAKKSAPKKAAAKKTL
jgi:DNA topoisomerase-1